MDFSSEFHSLSLGWGADLYTTKKCKLLACASGNRRGKGSEPSRAARTSLCLSVCLVMCGVCVVYSVDVLGCVCVCVLGQGIQCVGCVYRLGWQARHTAGGIGGRAGTLWSEEEEGIVVTVHGPS